MLDSTAPSGDAVTPAPDLAPASALLEGVTVDYCVDAAKARRLLGRMVASGQIALDIETAPTKRRSIGSPLCGKQGRPRRAS